MRKLKTGYALLLGAILSTAQLASFNANAVELSLKGSYTQGGIVIGKTSPENKVWVNDKAVTVSKNGDFIFGFNRDDELTHQLKVKSKDGQSITKKIDIAKREYDIQRIEGVAQKYVSPPESVLTRIRNDNKQIGEARAVKSQRTDFLEDIILPVKGRISGVYGSQRYFNGEPKRPHFGLDIAAKTGTPIYAPLSGKVTLAHKDMYYSGGTMIIDHGHNLSSTYIHLHKLSVKVGDVVKKGDKIGEVGATGRVTGPHLDWRFNLDGKRLDPRLVIDISKL